MTLHASCEKADSENAATMSSSPPQPTNAMKRRFILIGAISVICASNLFAARSSANYSIPTESTGSAGLNTQSANYSFNGNAVGEFGAGGSAIVTSTDYTGKNGYVGGLFDLVSLSITASSINLNETASRQLMAAALVDDGTMLGALDPSSVAWSS